jgi:cation transport ATPase
VSYRRHNMMNSDFLKKIESFLPLIISAILAYILQWKVADLIWGTWVGSLLVGLLVIAGSFVLIIRNIFKARFQEPPTLPALFSFIVFGALGFYVYTFFHLVLAMILSKFSAFSHEIPFQPNPKFVLDLAKIYWQETVIMFYFTISYLYQSLKYHQESGDLGHLLDTQAKMPMLIFSGMMLNVVLIIALIPTAIVFGFFISETKINSPLLVCLLIFWLFSINHKVRSYRAKPPKTPIRD